MSVEEVFQKVKKSQVIEEWQQSERRKNPLVEEWIKRKKRKTMPSHSHPH